MKREPKLTEAPSSAEYEDDLRKETAQNVSSYLDDKEYFKRSRNAGSAGTAPAQRQAQRSTGAGQKSASSGSSRVRSVSPDSEYSRSSSGASSSAGRRQAAYSEDGYAGRRQAAYSEDGYAGKRQAAYADEEYGRRDERSRNRASADEEYGRRAERSRSRASAAPDKQKKKKKKKKRSFGRFIGKLAGICVAIILILAILLCIPATRYWAASIILRTPIGTAAASAYLGSEYNSNVRDSEFDSSLIEKNSGVSGYAMYYTFALMGVDARDEDLEDGSRTDTMIVVSVNRLTGSIKMASIARDTYLYMSCDGTTKYAKANAAYAYWGAEGTISMLNQNFDLNIQDYVVVNFAGLTTIVDLIGGITIEVTEAELEYVNKYVKEQSSIDGVDYELLTETGTVTLTGAQATAYCRIRYTNFISPDDGTVYTSDWGRTARQRYVLTALLSQMRSTSATKLASAAKTVCAENTGDDRFIISSLSIGQLTSLLGMCLVGDIDDTSSFPVSGEYYSASLSVGDSVIPDTLEENAVLLHEFLYNDTNYSVSSDLSSVAASARSTLN